MIFFKWKKRIKNPILKTFYNLKLHNPVIPRHNFVDITSCSICATSVSATQIVPEFRDPCIREPKLSNTKIYAFAIFV